MSFRKVKSIGVAVVEDAGDAGRRDHSYCVNVVVEL